MSTKHTWLKDVGDNLARCMVCGEGATHEEPLGHSREECSGKRQPSPCSRCDNLLVVGDNLRKKVAELTECLRDPDLRHGPDLETLAILRQLHVATSELRLGDLDRGSVVLIAAAHVQASEYLKRVDRTETE